MAYTKTQWVNNEEPSINAENLNKMEQGIADAQSSAQWGSITGQLSNQTDLNNELSALNSNLNQKVSSVNGETPDTNGNVSLNAEDIPADGVGFKDVSGNPIIVTDAVADNAQNLSVDFEPIQDLHGYDHPWAGGAGKNKLPNNVSSQTIYGVTYTVNSDGSVTVNGTATNTSLFPFAPLGTFLKDNTEYIVNGNTNSSAFLQMQTASYGGVANVDDGYTWTYSSDGNIQNLVIRVNTGVTVNNQTLYPMIRLASETDATFEPYSNICPISGRTQVEITNKDSEDVEQASVTVDLGQTVYGGTLNVTTGELTVETANIASYNGESIGEPWWSSMDEYVVGATPTTGAQVVYTLATPTTVSLTPTQLVLLTGYNILTTDGDNINLRYTGTVASNVQSEIDEFEESTRTLAGSLAMIETSPATANHAVGSYLMLNNRLCKVTSAIATGEQIIVGSNVQYTTVAEELAAILAQINA